MPHGELWPWTAATGRAWDCQPNTLIAGEVSQGLTDEGSSALSILTLCLWLGSNWALSRLRKLWRRLSSWEVDTELLQRSRLCLS